MGLLQMLVLSMLTPTVDASGWAVRPSIDANGKVAGVDNLMKGLALSLCIRPGMSRGVLLRYPMLSLRGPFAMVGAWGGPGRIQSAYMYPEYGVVIWFREGRVTSVTWSPDPHPHEALDALGTTPVAAVREFPGSVK